VTSSPAKSTGCAKRSLPSTRASHRRPPQGWRTQRSRTQARPVCDAHDEAAGDEEHTGASNEPTDRCPPPDGRRVAPPKPPCSLRWPVASRRTAGQVAQKTGLARGTVSTTLSKLAQTGEAQKAERGYRIAPAAEAAPTPSSAPATSGE
jgi:hypothetical protein